MGEIGKLGPRAPVDTAGRVEAPTLAPEGAAIDRSEGPELRTPLGPRPDLPSPRGSGSPVPRRLQHLLKKLESDPGFGSGFLEGAGANEPEVVDRVGDLFQGARREQLRAALGRALEVMDLHPDRMAHEVERQLGGRVAYELSETREDPERAAGVIAGHLAQHQTLAKRTRLATVANRLDDITKKVLAEAPPPRKAPRVRDRAPPMKIGAESQDGLAGKRLRTDGRISGRRFAGAYREAELQRAASLGLAVDAAADAFLDQVGASAGFDPTTGTIRIRADATALEWFHEMNHAEQWLELGPEAYGQQTRLEKELHVFRAVQAHSAEFNAYEYEAARNYIVRLAESAGVPVPEEAR